MDKYLIHIHWCIAKYISSEPKISFGILEKKRVLEKTLQNSTIFTAKI